MIVLNQLLHALIIFRSYDTPDVPNISCENIAEGHSGLGSSRRRAEQEAAAKILLALGES